ncbi:hypothetical protein BE221DRAFT_189719 [Ostreococcus tauri]|uniref:Uncharacterized protein n=1 Tax=Ostreococcus tauri TaxID=70448 RepID=A0A1Y5IFU2_OSTTA|nr:hypothetical protein BE221DRAFT_189719 [Ostreococcus tauri]
MPLAAASEERQSLIHRPREPASCDASSSYFDEDARERSTARRLRAFGLGAFTVALVACGALTVDMARHVAKTRTRATTASLGAPRSVVGSRIWTPNVPRDQVNTQALAMAEMDQYPLTGKELEEAKRETQDKLFPMYDERRYLDGASRRRRKLETPVYVISVSNSTVDSKHANVIVSSLMRLYELNSTNRNLVQVQEAVYPVKWPQTLDLAEEAVEELKRRHPNQHYHWFDNLEVAKSHGGTLPRGLGFLSHHIGCLFSHMRMWRLHQKNLNKWTIIYESDGWWNQHVNGASLQSVVDNAPEHADVIFLHPNSPASGQFVKQWPSGKGMNYMYQYNKVLGAAGLQAYMIGPQFTEKILDLIHYLRGADMVDAWLLLNICGRRDDRYATKKMRLNCYHVQDKIKPPHEIGGYLPDWYSPHEHTARTTDNWPKFLEYHMRGDLYEQSRSERYANFLAGNETGWGRFNDQEARERAAKKELAKMAEKARKGDVNLTQPQLGRIHRFFGRSRAV